MIRVMLVDDQELVRSGFRIILESEPDIEVIAEAVNGEDAITAAAKHTPDVICMDVEMPQLNGIEASRQILAAQPETGVLILTTFGHEQYLFDALAAGVSGFLLKTSRAEQLIDAVRTIAAGNALLGPDVTRAVIDRVSANREAVAAPEAAAFSAEGSGSSALEGAMEKAGLTAREREVLTRVAKGKSNSEIAAELFLGEATVKTHVSNLLQKLGVRDRIQAVVWAHTQGQPRPAE
ncbi:response regulator transcription factor [Leucobacter coleopterorum]|uniref:Response regulator transcription factor n=1 Tax=Leucobacter coleopterorum TaxID=2714933 RepID=A0ABX6JXL8_9MICO|nr:response regulator transcription factor [Leucobacter coleopterorum]QIM17677.1 response regulator transcription factor [Leucobacter coleopterorum]